MALNAVIKGKTGEQEVARELNAIINDELVKAGFEHPKTVVVQRNQNQSAVGGKDLLLGGLPIAIEVKRQEQLSVESWWAQCATAAQRNKEYPILIYRQNNKKWHVVMWGQLSVTTTKVTYARVTISFHDFLAWFRQYVVSSIQGGWIPKV